MKKTMMLLSLLLLVVTSCKKDTDEITQLLTSVPSGAEAVVIVDYEALVNAMGGKFDGDKIELGKDVEKMLKGLPSSKRKSLEKGLDGSSGINLKTAVVFYNSGAAYLSMVLDDEKKFIKFIEENNDEKFKKESGGVKVAGNIAVKDSQCWVLLSGNRIDADAIKKFASLKDSESFLTTAMGEKLLTDGAQIRGWVKFNEILSTFMSRTEAAQVKMVAGLVFDEPDGLGFSIESKKGEIVSKATILDEKGNPAKFQLPLGKVDGSALQLLGSTCQGMVALSITPELVNTIDKLASSFGGADVGGMRQILQNINGTIGGIGNLENESFNVMISTDGPISETLSSMLNELPGGYTQNGKYIMLSQGYVSGDLSVETCAKVLNGSNWGIIYSPSVLKQTSYSYQSLLESLNYMAVKLNPTSGGIELEVLIKTNNSKENALLTVLKQAFAEAY